MSPSPTNPVPTGPEPERINGEQLEHLQQVVQLGEYRVDSDQVARAMLERIGARLIDRTVINERGGDRVLRRALNDLQAV